MDHPRRVQILRAIVEDYVHSREPVGSKALVERHRLPVSSATVRNDMAALEDAGLIVAPHTSSGRIPTDQGYRVFVDQIAAVQPLSPAQRRAIQVFLEDAQDIDDVMERTVRLLAQLTHQAAVIQYPVRTGTTVRHVELVDVGAAVLVILIPTSGRVAQRAVELRTALDEPQLLELRARVLARVLGQALDAVPSAVAGLGETLPAELREAGDAVGETLSLLASATDEHRLVMAGTANLARFSGDFPQSISPVLEALEEQVTMLRLLSEMQQDERGVAVRIGSEECDDPLAEASVVATGYGPRAASKVGVVGPTRMDYPTTMASVRAVARYLSRNLGD
ncbi:heat-inducible transcriptional repressor HrcA [Kocuria rhizophila]|uniref:Heat-inducible transcription repressor HrcA n=2 Tax=Bacteria TaxID=2 RepID=A0AAX2SFX2_KOCRH|nr:heat-inducible transcriptional repressor HrcA [Kocuria rhizophila]MBO4144518.1 heat-inducible transcriptional repressor HrcA [Kocuria rhizophila]MCG7424824.1 heat-inducible transcriptional repressor HrcA [Kocuria rhizophila]MCT1455801.1 heat-inducible transcriptional repressor HrcA [Kocuria rhizophila]MCT1544512.1 heat-inducible transcriptional repressor HrcA [Kocuria rhizophila]MCT1956923.1 heat-inducible transcriptional repressor HrcA [Kocuria rhizophila]